MNNKQKIRAEVVRLKETVGAGLSAYDMGEENGAFDAYEKVLKFIDSLPEEPVSDDLEKVAGEYAHEQGLKQITGKWESKEAVDFQADHGLYFNIDLINAFIAGANCQKQQMVDKAFKYINYQLNLPSDFEQHFRKAMEEEK